MNRTTHFAVAGIACAFGLLIGITLNPASVLAQFTQWTRDEVTPVVIVEPSVNGFIPKGGTALQGSWRKDKVIPFLSVRSDNLGDFVPADGGYGSILGNSWQKDEVKPFVLLKPNGLGAFVPAN